MNASFLQDDKGNNSSTRLGTLLWLVGILVAWLYTVFTTGTITDLPPGILATLGMLLTAKVAQKHVEGQSPAEPYRDAAK